MIAGFYVNSLVRMKFHYCSS